jgi:hypothetical protein
MTNEGKTGRDKAMASALNYFGATVGDQALRVAFDEARSTGVDGNSLPL